MKHKSLSMILIYILSVSLLIATSIATADDRPLTNVDIVKMIKAQLGDDTVVRAIQSGLSNFDTSPDALIALKNNGASAKILDAILAAKAPKLSEPQLKNGNSPNIPEWAANRSKATASFNQVVLVDGDTRTPLDIMY